MTNCPGPCNATWRTTGEGTPFPGEPTWCPPCTTRIRQALTELDDLAALLTATADGHREQQTSPARRRTHTPSPSAASDDLDELTRTLTEWENAYRDLRRWPSPPRRGHLATRTTATIAWLTTHLDGILASEIAEDFGREIRQWHRELATKAKAGTGYHRKPVPCPRCGLKLLTLHDGADHVVCAGCNRHMPMSEYWEHLHATARQFEQTG